MENSVRHNVYAIAVVSFCIGILYGIHARAEGPTVTQDSTNSMIAGMNRDECKTAKTDTQLELDEAAVRVKAEAQKEELNKSVKPGDVDAATILSERVRSQDQLKVLSKRMNSTLYALQNDCAEQDSETQSLVDRMNKSSHAVDTMISILASQTKDAEASQPTLPRYRNH